VATVLVVDDAPNTRELLERNLGGEGYRVFTADGVAQAIAVLQGVPVDLVIADLKMPGGNGLDLIRHVRENYPDSEAMMITGYASIDGAVSAVKAGAEEYLAKPFTEDELREAVRRVLDKLRVRRAAGGGEAPRPPTAHGLIGESAAMQGVFRAIAKAAATTATVLITGESGTGKELVARAIHYGGSRAAGPFVAVNCGGIPEGLIESELFGHVKGAFTSATESRAGFFQTADGGTVFLDEIAELKSPLQVSLLRVLQDRQVRMVGASRTQKVDVRIVAATNKDLVALTRKDLFREDLFFRLNVVAITVPPLRDRGDDVLLLVRHFLDKFAAEYGKPVPHLSDAALHAIRQADWPGNVRELENAVQRLVVMADRELVDVCDLPASMRFSAVRAGNGLQRTLGEVEAEHIRNVLAATGGNRTRAAAILGIDRKTLRLKLHAYGLGR
jgi:DNA-binding NtrC family response regulator